MLFKDIIGQRLAVDSIKKAIENKRQAHAYLFIGPDGAGKSLLAKVFAKALNCLSIEKDAAEPCGDCISCKKIEENIHPDVMWVSSEGKSSQVTINSVRKVEQAMSLKPYEGRVKVYVVDGADNMTQEAANCLLKTLEEPPKDTIMILLASNIFKLMPTIVSRCQKIALHPLSEELIKDELMRKHSLDQAKALYVARFAEGSLGRAFKILEEDIFSIRGKVIDEFILPKRLGYEDTWLYDEARDKVNDALNMLSTYFRDLLVFSLLKSADLLVNLDKADEIAKNSGRYTVEKLEEIIEAISTTQHRIKRNANIKIALASMRLSIT